MNYKQKAIKTMIYLVVLLVLGIALILLVAFTARDRTVLLSGAQTFVTSDQQTRSYRSSAGERVDNIIVALHGFSDTSRRFAYYSGLHNAAGANDLVVYPDAITPSSSQLETGWNAGFCCGSGWRSDTDDVAFIAELIEQLKISHNAPDAKVYLTGFSNGAFMAMRIAAEHPELVDAVAAVSGTIGTTNFQLEPTQPVPILLMHGELDNRVSFNGGHGISDPEFDWLSFQDTTSAWQAVNDDLAVTSVITHPNDAHQWHDWRLLNVWHQTPLASQQVLDFFNSVSADGNN